MDTIKTNPKIAAIRRAIEKYIHPSGSRSDLWVEPSR